MTVFIKILLIIFGIALAAFFAGAETGMYRLSRFYVRLGLEKKQRFFKTLGKLLNDTHGVIFSLLIGTNLAHFFVTSLVTVMLVNSINNSHSAELYATIIITPILFVFSELIPKNLFIYHADSLTPPLSPLLWVFHRVFVLTGIVPMLKILANLISKLTKSSKVSQPAMVAVYRHQISQIASDTIEEGILTPIQTKIIKRLVNIPDIKITEIMTPLHKVHSVNINISRESLLEELKKSDYTRPAVYQDSPENVVGYINIYQALNSTDDFSDVKSFLKPIIKLSSKISVTEALDTLKKDNQRIAAVTSGKNSNAIGVVTINDLVEEFIGELTGI